MSLLLTDSAWSMQPEASGSPGPGTQGAPSGGGGGGGTPPGGCAGGSSQLLMLAIMFGIFYFLLIRPQQKRQRELDDLLKSLRKGDKVRTTGGIRGEIIELNDQDVTLLIADKVKINVLRSHVATRLDKPAAGKSDGGDDKAAAS